MKEKFIKSRFIIIFFSILLLLPVLGILIFVSLLLNQPTFLEDVAPLLFFLPTTPLIVIIILCILLIICVIFGIYGAINHTKRALMVYIIFCVICIFIEIIFFIGITVDLLTVNPYYDITRDPSTFEIMLMIGKKVITTIENNPSRWITIQNEMECCGFDFGSIYLNNNNIDEINSGDLCNNYISEKATYATIKNQLLIITTAYPELNNEATDLYLSKKESEDIPDNFFCRDIIGNNFNKNITPALLITGFILFYQTLALIAAFNMFLKKKTLNDKFKTRATGGFGNYGSKNSTLSMTSSLHSHGEFATGDKLSSNPSNSSLQKDYQGQTPMFLHVEDQIRPSNLSQTSRTTGSLYNQGFVTGTTNEDMIQDRRLTREDSVMLYGTSKAPDWVT